MERIIKKYDFNYEAVFPYFIDHIGCGKTLSEKIVKKINFRFGKFYTFLPDNIRPNWLFEFSSGIILPSEPCIVIPMDWECGGFINDFLQKNENNYAIVEDYMEDAHTYTSDDFNIKMTPYKDEVYYSLNQKNTIEEICQAIRRGENWHTLIILTSLESGDKIVSLNDEIIDEICDNVQYVLAGAYDGDAYIFWEKCFNSQN